MIPRIMGGYKDKLRELGMTTPKRIRERGAMIQTWRVLTGKDRVDPTKWLVLQGEQVREGGTFTRNHNR